MIFIKHSEEIYVNESIDVRRLSLLYHDVHFWNCDYTLEKTDATKDSIAIKLSPDLVSLRYRNSFMPYAKVSIKQNEQTLSVDAKFSFNPAVYVILAMMTVILPIFQILILTNNNSNLTIESFLPLMFLAFGYFSSYLILSASSKNLFGIITGKLIRYDPSL